MNTIRTCLQADLVRFTPFVLQIDALWLLFLKADMSYLRGPLSTGATYRRVEVNSDVYPSPFQLLRNRASLTYYSPLWRHWTSQNFPAEIFINQEHLMKKVLCEDCKEITITRSRSACQDQVKHELRFEFSVKYNFGPLFGRTHRFYIVWNSKIPIHHLITETHFLSLLPVLQFGQSKRLLGFR